MSRSNKLVLLSIVVSRALASPQGQPYLPSSIEAQIYSIYPSEVPDNSYGSAYFSAHPAAYSTFEAKISSLEAANPSYFPTNGGNFFSQPITGISDLGLSPTQSAELLSAASAFEAPIITADITATAGVLSYISAHPAAFSSYLAEASSIIGTDLPTGAGGFGGGAGGAGLPTAPIFTMSPQGSQASQAGATTRQSSAANTQVTSQVTLRTTQQSTQQQQQTATQTSQTPAAFTHAGNRAAMQTPALALGLSGAAVAAVAGIAALL